MSTATPDLAQALARATDELLAAREPGGHWTGRLSSSALATATAVCALALYRQQTDEGKLDALISRGLDWLAANINSDGGWGDTDRSSSNLSTTTLCWAAFGAADERSHSDVVRRAENFLRKAAGGTEPASIAAAIMNRYGRDRTFSIPILATCAMAGRFGAGPDAWRFVRPLPFELAALPRQWFGALQLPVVSYALPALIALGQVIHQHRPTRNPFARWLRDAARKPTLRVLEEIQPSNGGFLEATPLTSFVTMSLVSAGLADHPVAERGVGFLCASVRDDGSWPIDTNLATWLTTLSVNAMSAGVNPPLERGERRALREWLLGQQFRTVHPYTGAAPGGWAWTDLPGGVPDADDTAGALLALRHLGDLDDEIRDAARAGVNWLLDLQNRDGGIPTFCRGWGALPFDRSSPDLTAHALRAWKAWMPELPLEEPRIHRASERAMDFLAKTQRADGSWLPLWFGNQHAPDDANPTYGTARVLSALAQEARPELVRRGVRWLVAAQNEDGSWGGISGGSPSIEETALAIDALARCSENGGAMPAVEAGVRWLLGRVGSGEWREPAPIGFYFAKLWYYERLYPMIFTVEALGIVSRLRNHERLADPLPASSR